MWMAEYQAAHGVPYVFKDAKDGTAAARIIKCGFTPEQLIEVAKAAWKRPDGFCCKHAAELSRFVSQFNAIHNELKSNPNGPTKPNPRNEGTGIDAAEHGRLIAAKIARDHERERLREQQEAAARQPASEPLPGQVAESDNL